MGSSGIVVRDCNEISLSPPSSYTKRDWNKKIFFSPFGGSAGRPVLRFFFSFGLRRVKKGMLDEISFETSLLCPSISSFQADISGSGRGGREKH
jgi:hypothetical protein